MRTHDPHWEPDPNMYVLVIHADVDFSVDSSRRKYDFKPKKRKRNETGNHEGSSEDDDLEESVRTISSLLQGAEGNVAMLPSRILAVGLSNNPADRGVSGVGGHELAQRVANISARIVANAMAEDGEEEEVDELVDELEGDGEEEVGGGGKGPVREVVRMKGWDEEDDSDAFPVPLRPRKGREWEEVTAAVELDC
jgi:hypothetical protein